MADSPKPSEERSVTSRARLRKPRTWVGIDIGSRTSDIAVVGPDGISLAHKRVSSDAAGLKEAQALLREHAHRRRDLMPIGLEDPNTLIAETLRVAGFDVRNVHPVALARFREGQAPSRTKSDQADAVALANIVRVQGSKHRPLATNSDECAALRVVTRAAREQAKERRRVEHRMWMMLHKYYPAANATFSGFSRRDVRVALRYVPTPALAKRLGERGLAEQLALAGRQRGVRSWSHEALLGLRRPALRLNAATESAYGIALLTMLDQLDQIVDSQQRLEDQALEMARAHPLWPIYSSFPALGRIVGACVLSEIGDDPHRISSGRGLASLAGVAPITFASGTSCNVQRRTVYNRHLGDAVRAWGLPLIAHSEPARAIYDAAREKGDRYPAALRRTLNRYLRSLHACVLAGESYDEAMMLITA